MVNNKICDLRAGKDDNIPAGCGYVNNVGTQILSSAWGIATTGVPLFTAFAGSGVDPFYPAPFVNDYAFVTDAAANIEGADKCLFHPSPTGVGHYHSPSPCQYNPALINDPGPYESDFKDYMEA